MKFNKDISLCAYVGFMVVTILVLEIINYVWLDDYENRITMSEKYSNHIQKNYKSLIGVIHDKDVNMYKDTTEYAYNENLDYDLDFYNMDNTELYTLKYNSINVDDTKISCCIYINMDKHKDRRKYMDELTRKYFPNALTLRLDALTGTNKGVAILKSHTAALQIAACMDGYTLILEDDFQFEKDMDIEKVNGIISNSHEQCKGYDVLMLTSFPRIWGKVKDTDFMRVLDSSNAAGYMVKGSYARNVMVPLFKNHLHFLNFRHFTDNDCNDQIWKNLQKEHKWIAYHTQIGNQYGDLNSFGHTVDNRIIINNNKNYVQHNGSSYGIIQTKEIIWDELNK